MNNSEKDFNADAFEADIRDLNAIPSSLECDNSVVGDIMINPTELGKFRFEMETPSGIIDAEALKSMDLSYKYSGPATMIMVTPHSNSRTIMLNGLSIDLDMSQRYTFKSNSMTVFLRNIRDNKSTNFCWSIEIYAMETKIEPIPGVLSNAENSNELATTVPAQKCQNVGAQAASVDIFKLDEFDSFNGEPDEAAVEDFLTLNVGDKADSFGRNKSFEQSQNYQERANTFNTMSFPSKQQTSLSNNVVDVIAGIVCMMIKAGMESGATAAL